MLPLNSAAPYVFAQGRRRDDAQGLSRHDQRQACSTAAATNMAECSRDYGSIFRQENFEMVVADPLSLAGFTTSTTILERSDLGWRTRSETTTNVWSEADGKGGYLYPYLATVKTFIGPEGKDQPFAEKTVHGEIARSWI
jgi:hypothetical protein